LRAVPSSSRRCPDQGTFALLGGTPVRDDESDRVSVALKDLLS
jgi:hypothetical protein